MQSTPYKITLQPGFKKKAIITHTLPTHCLYTIPYASPVLITIPGTTSISIQQYSRSNIGFEIHAVSAVKGANLLMQVTEPFVLFFCHITPQAIYLFNKKKGFYVFKGRHCAPVLMEAGKYRMILRPGKYDYLLFSIRTALFAKIVMDAGLEYLQKKIPTSLGSTFFLPVIPISIAIKKLLLQLQQAGNR